MTVVMGVILNKQSWNLNDEEKNINKKELNLWVMHIRMVEKHDSVYFRGGGGIKS